MDFLTNLAIFYQTSPHFGGKLTSCVAVLAQNTSVGDFRPMLYYFKLNISLLEMFMKPREEIMDKCVLQPHNSLLSQPPFWRKTDKLCHCSSPKYTCVCLYTGTIPFELQY